MKKDNKGFSLLELMIAVIILAIIIVPMLRGFVSSHNVNAKSRHLMRATTLAQDEMEIFEKEKLEDLLVMEDTDPAGNKIPRYTVDEKKMQKTDPADSTKQLEHITYQFKREGVINDESGRDMFDVVVTLDPTVSPDGAPAGVYETTNTEKMLVMNTVSGVDSATYIQRVRNEVNANGADEEVYKLYAIRQLPDGITGQSWTADMFGQELKRTITLKIEQEDQAGVMTTVAKIRYDYETQYGNVPPEYRNYTTKDKIFFNNAQTLDEDGNPIELKSVYLYYAPRYNDTSLASLVGKTISPDEIIIENKDKLPVNIYIIRQNILDPTDDTKKLGVYWDETTKSMKYEVPDDYEVNVTINEGFGADGKTYGRYFTNLNLGQNPGIFGQGKDAKITLNDCDNPGRIFTKDEILEYTGLKALDATEAKDRIYTMETAVYEHGADPSTSDPVVRLTGTKIE